MPQAARDRARARTRERARGFLLHVVVLLFDKSTENSEASIVDGQRPARDGHDLEVHLVELRQGFFGHYLLHSAELGDPAVLKSADVVGVEGGLVDLVENQDYRLAQLVAQPPDDLHEIGGVVDVQVVGGLVQQDILGVLGNDHIQGNGTFPFRGQHLRHLPGKHDSLIPDVGRAQVQAGLLYAALELLLRTGQGQPCGLA